LEGFLLWLKWVFGPIAEHRNQSAPAKYHPVGVMIEIGFWACIAPVYGNRGETPCPRGGR
jgi:hypothetical protein